MHCAKCNVKMQQANLENCGPAPGNNFDLEVCQGQGIVMVQIKRACLKDHACQISMLYHLNTSEDMSQVKVFETDGRTDRQTNEF